MRGGEEEELLEVEKEEKVAAARGRRGAERRGVVLTRTGAFLIIICLSLRISREERGTPRRAAVGGREKVPTKKRGLQEKEGALSRGGKERKRGKSPERVAARGKERGRGG